MVKNILIFIICYAFVLFSCKRQKYNVEILKINPNEAKEYINLSEFVDFLHFIKLQTDLNCILERIAMIIIKSKYIYVCNAGQMIIFIFDKKGNFITILDKRGKGPGEYLNFNGVFIDDNENFIEIVYGEKLIKYSNIDFKLLEERPAARIYANSFRKFKGVYYYATQQMENIVNGKKTNAQLIIEKNGKVIKTLFNKNISTGNI